MIDTTGEVKDVVFPDEDTLRNAGNKNWEKKWQNKKDSIRLTSGAVKKFGVEGACVVCACC